jgi:uncharacterized repeat protein (TIGR02543 family)
MSKKQLWNLPQMLKIDKKIWGIRVRKTLIVALIAPLFTVISATIPERASAAFQSASDGTCTQDVGSTTGVTVTVDGRDCIVTFTNTTANSWVVPANGTNFQILVVGGGGGGGADGGNGGGGGELRYSSGSPSWIPAAGTTLSIQVGAGGAPASNGTASTVAWGGSTRYQANGGAGGGGWQSTVVPTGGSGGSGGTGTNGQSATAVPPNSSCVASVSARQEPSSANWFSTRWFFNGGGGVGGALATTAPSNSISGSSKFYGGAGGAGWGSSINSASVGPIFGLAGGGTVNNTSTSGGRGANWQYEAGESTVSRAGASVGGNGVNGTGGGGGGGNACDPTMNGVAVQNLVFKRTSGGSGGTGSVTIRYTNVFTVTFNANNGTGSPSVSTASQTLASNTVTLATAGTLSRSGFRFSGWNTLANGTGTSYTAGSSFIPTNDITLFAQWTSVVSYDGNTATTTRAIESTTAIGTAANITLSSGRLARGNPIASGLILNLDASDASTVSGSSWANKVAGVSGAEASATLVGSPTYNASDGAFSLNGSNQFFTLGNTNYLFNGALPFTLNLSFKASDPNKDNCLIGNFNGAVGATYMFRLSGGVLVANRNVSPWQVAGTTQIPAGEIVYASYSFDGSNMRVYLNGSLHATSALISASVSHNGGARIGACLDSNSSSRFFKGQIYNAQIYNRALSAAEITTNFDNLLPNRLASKNNFTLGAWNTQSNGSGTSFGTQSTDLAALPTPFFRVSAENYSAGTLTASVGGSNLSITKNGSPVLNSNSGGGFGANARFATISGATGDGFRLGNTELSNYTFCGMARYKDLDTGVRSTRGRIFAYGSGTNWLSGWYDRGTKNFFHNEWLLGHNTVGDPNWHVVCDSGNQIYWDGVKQTVNQGAYTSLPPLAINWSASGDNSHFEFTEAIVYNQALSDAEINAIFRYFKNKFGLTNVTTNALNAAKFVPPTDYSSSGDATLQAIWNSQVTYDGNRQTSGVAPAPQIVTNSGATVASVGTLARSGFTFVGWNTAADGSGTRFAPGSALTNDGNKLLYAQWVVPVALPIAAVNPTSLSPYMRLVASDYDAANKVWRDSSGNSRNVTRVIGNPTLVTTTGNGSSKSFQTIAGGTADKFYFDNDPISTNWTVFALSRYSGASNRGRIISGNYAAGASQDSNGNWLFGQWAGQAAVAHYNSWVSSSSAPVGLNLTDWVMSTAYPSNYRYNGIVRGTSGGTAELPPLGINTWTGEQSDYQVAEVIIFNRTLNLSEIRQIEDYFAERYGLAYSKVGIYQNSNTLAIGAGVGGRSETFTATNGLGTKTFTISPSRSGITLDTSTANSVALVVSPVTATGVYAQTITATDAAGETATHVVTVTVSPSVKFDTSTATTVITTHRRGVTLQLNTVFGVGTKVFTMTSAGTGITLDTSTAASGFATLRVDTFTATGTYTQLITVTDDTRIRSTYTVTITINGPPTISSTSAITTTPVTSGLRLNLDAGDPASYSNSGNTWTDLSGNSRNATWQVSPTFSTSNGGTFDLNGTSQFATTSSIASDVFTVEVWAKFNALNNNYACLVTNVYTGDKINYAICFWGDSKIRAGYHQSGTGWVGGQTGTFTPVVGTWYQFVYSVNKVGANYIGTLYVNNAAVTGTTSSTIAPASDAAGMRIGRRWDSGEYINGSIPVVRIYNRALSATEIAQNYNAILTRFNNNPTNSVTITTTESVTASSSIYYAGLGTGNKTFALSNPTAGLSIDTSTVNTVRLNAANTLTATSTTVARSVSQVITATDSTGVAAATPVYVTTVINPRVIITDATPGTLSTTFGRIAYDTFTATQGTGTKTFTVSSASFASAFVMTNPSTNVGLLTVANNLPTGTYPVTVTATDSVGGITTLALSVLVNPAPTIVGATGNSVTTTVARSASLRINVVGGTGTRTISWTSPNAGITIDSSTLAAQNFITLGVSSSVPVRTYSFAITAADSFSVRASDTFTVTVNRWPVIASPTTVTSGLKISLDAGNSSSYSGSGTTWTDMSGNGKNGTWQQSPTFNSASGGSIAIGSSTSQYMLSSGLGATNVLTAEAWVKFNVIPANDNCIISDRYTASFINYSICFRNDGKIYGGYWNGTNGWVSSAGTTTPLINTWYHFAYTVSLSGSTYTSILYQNGVAVGSPVTSTVSPNSSNLGFLVGTNWRADTTVVNGDIAIVRVYGRALTAAEVVQNYNAQGLRFTATNSGTDSATVTQGVAGSITSVSAAEGTGTKTFALSGAVTGFSLSNPAANAFSLALPDTLTAVSATTARTITETVTATDQAGATTARVYTITVNPPIRIESTTSTITTTSGIVAWDTFTATLGTGNKTFTFAGTPNTNGFTLTQANNQAVLRVGQTVNPGTYSLTITATDAVGAVTTIIKTVVVNSLPTISGNSSVTGTRGYTFNSPTYSAAGGTGNLTFSITTSPAIPGGNVSGIRLSGTTGTPTIIVESTTVADTYTVTLRVTDSLTAFSTFIVTLKVNPPVTLSGSLTLSKVYGEELSQVYTTSGGTPPFRILASTICTSEKSTYIGNGTNGTLGVTYTVESFNGVGSCNWAVPKDVSNVSVLTVAGGGGGGGTAWAGGGGAGGVVFANSVTVTPGAELPIVVGAGGAGGQNNNTCSSGSSPSQGSNGNNSSFNATFTAVGGGGGGGYGWDGRAGCGTGKPGGSGGGAGETDYNPVRATSTQGTFAGATSSGNSGGITVFLSGIQAGSGGGGAGGIGASTGNSRNHVAGNGGTGIAYSITGTSTFYGGGGGGATCISGCTAGATVGAGGAGGGGNGGHGGASPVNGTNGLGGGGGGSQTGLGATGGSGTVIVRYITPAVDTETTRITLDTLSVTPTGSLRLNAPRNLPVGTYTQTVTVLDSAATPASTSATITLTVTKATPTLTLSLPGSVTTAKYGNPVTISAIATTPGRVAFVNGSETITTCSSVATTAGLATCSWTPTVVGATTLRATLTPTDTANYNSSAQVNLAITVAKADTLTVTVTSLTRQYTGSAVAVTGAFTTSGLVAIDSLTAISMLYAGTANDGIPYSNTTAPTSAGTYSIRPNFPTNANAYTFVAGSLGTTSAVSNYESVTVVAGTLTINRAPQVLSFTYPDSNTATYSPTGTITPTAITRLDSAMRTFSSSTLSKCTIDSTTAVISIVEAGSCQVSMAVEQTFNYLADTATATVTINKAARTFSLTPAVSTLKYAESTTVAATLSGGSLDGTISYTLGSPAGCTFDPLSGELLAISGTIQCPLTATISEGINYLAETTTAMALTIARADAPVITIDTITAMDHTPGIRAIVIPTYNVSGLKNLDTADSMTFTYSFISNPFETFTYSDTRTPIDAGTYRITPSALTLSTGLMSNYETPTYSSSAINFIINRIGQESVTILTTNGEVDVPFTLQASGGSTNGAVTFTKLSGTSCSVTSNSLSASASGICVLSVTRAGNRNYLPFTSESITVMVRNFVIFQVTVPANPNTGITVTPTTPIVKGPDVCTSGCVPTLTGADIYDVAEGDLIILTGTNLLTVTKVYFNIYTVAPNFTANSDTELAVRVPADLPFGDATIEVVSPGGTSNRLFDFIIGP